MDKEGDGCAGLFMSNSDVEMPGTGNAEADIQNHIKQIDGYNEKVNKLLAGSLDGADVCEDYLKNFSEPAKKELMLISKKCKWNL